MRQLSQIRDRASAPGGGETSPRATGSGHMRLIRRLGALAVLALAAALLPVASAQASHSQIALFEDDGGLGLNATGTMAQLRLLGVQEVRLYIEWSAVTANPLSFTKPASFDSASPSPASSDSAINGYHWGRIDTIVAAARQDHIKLDFVLSGGAPYWAIGPHPAKGSVYVHYAWKPSAVEYGNFVHATVLRYGSAVRAWEIYNEPNFGEDLAPQTTNGADNAAAMYRTLVDMAWQAFASTHHTHDQITIGQLAARGVSRANNIFDQTKPLIFIRDLYCVGTNFKVLTGRAATNAGCPTTRAGQHDFASAHPGLFSNSGFGIHPYPQGLPPTQDSSRDPNYVTFNDIPRLESALDSVDRTYHRRGGTGIYNNEYGYVTRPPSTNRALTSPANAAVYINQAEYLSWRDPRIRTTMQYLLVDPPAKGPSQFFSGLYNSSMTPKPSLAAYRMPIWLPSSTGRRGQSTEVWGAIRPAALLGGPRAAIEWRSSSRASFKVIAHVTAGRGNGYFDVKVKFPGSGQVETVWSEPGLGTVTSRLAGVTLR